MTAMEPTWLNWLGLFVQLMGLSLLAIGGAITVAPDMHRYLVLQQGWLSDADFTTAIALSQAAPGPKVSRRAFGRERRYPITSGYIA